MEQWLPRGTSVTKEKRIKKMITASKDWQIYSTNQDSYVLAATRSIYKEWIYNYSLPEGICIDYNNYKVFCSTGNYLISSLDKGPYPNDSVQVEAFSIAFNTALKLFPDMDLQDAVYIEEYSLILPGAQSCELTKKECVYGKWLTGGVNISANSFKRIVQFMSWMPVAALNKSFELAGFEISETEDEETEKNEVISNDLQPVDSENVTIPTIITTDKFTLVGRPDLEQFFNDNIIDIVLNQQQYKRMGISFPGATILYGPPGCGKTYAVEKLAEYLGWKRFDIDSSSIASSFIHDTSKKISEVFNSAIKASPSIIVIDEMEAFLSSRNMAGPSGRISAQNTGSYL